ncbi:hypothetical protein K466DRAFT_592650 [Polyporus arcularius HHB13444]|uniref:Uncharacterized protein n=1 Tax=Polyporus arcularius HHB13444 TaxID=1314778 RepID=A0A5C3NNT5_9APHY|nr:hypothetical protein K466DRAFT_592650 [Polyporus arcularius HHB13444]
MPAPAAVTCVLRLKSSKVPRPALGIMAALHRSAASRCPLLAGSSSESESAASKVTTSAPNDADWRNRPSAPVETLRTMQTRASRWVGERPGNYLPLSLATYPPAAWHIHDTLRALTHSPDGGT